MRETNHLQKIAKERMAANGRNPRYRGYRSQSVGYRPELFERCARCGDMRLAHERPTGLVPDHPFQSASSPAQP